LPGMTNSNDLAPNGMIKNLNSYIRTDLCCAHTKHS